MRQLCYALLVMLVLASCRDKVICPTFQSTYILDDSVRSTYFSYLWYLDEDERKAHVSAGNDDAQMDSLGLDSLGPMVASAETNGGVDYFAYTAEYKVSPRGTKKTKYGIIKRTPLIPNFTRNIQLKTSPRENVLTPPEVTKDEEVEESSSVNDSTSVLPLDSAASLTRVSDTTAMSSPSDSTAVAELDEDAEKKKAWEQFKYGFNPLEEMQPDQAYYFQKYGWLLQNGLPPEEPVDSSAVASLDSLTADSTGRKKGLKGLFKRNKDKPKKEKKKKKSKNEEESEAPAENNEEAIKPEESSEEENPGGGN